MKTVILAGGFGTRLTEETTIRPKPMVEIGGYPILWHIMKIYETNGFNEFVVACGYKGEYIKEYFSNLSLYYADLRVDISKGTVTKHNNYGPKWCLDLIDTGKRTQTGGRIKRVKEWVDNKTFMMTYGDGLGNIGIQSLVNFHRKHGKLATLTAVRPPSRFGGLEIRDDQVVQFLEKPQIGEGWINGGFMVLEPEVFDYIEGDEIIFEREPLENLAKDSQLMVFKHDGFWQPMDTLREKMLLEELWNTGKAVWKTWNDE